MGRSYRTLLVKCGRSISHRRKAASSRTVSRDSLLYRAKEPLPTLSVRVFSCHNPSVSPRRPSNHRNRLGTVHMANYSRRRQPETWALANYHQSSSGRLYHDQQRSLPMWSRLDTFSSPSHRPSFVEKLVLVIAAKQRAGSVGPSHPMWPGKAGPL